MAVFKCKMCGGDLNLIEGQTVAECEYCGSRQTVPTADNEKKLNLFASANKLRFACEFDRAAGIYDAIKAEFPGEAESYWGLVLCKYGIEYVDDPATGKKIPTCHRSSYDSVMDDANLELAMDYADAAARKVYREESKQLEQIRKGILEVSSNEKPYDVFICYKETDENGDRTLDSVLAQDLYTALTDKGYRVFFSRITLQSKLGEAYEPYIFAALNSAKVMLAIGTDPEYYNAVWVKNEWSRYLKICAADKSKHLIPCYKDLDAYDLPKEFRPLQGVDLGKMGAVQDILFNMEKYIPLQKKTTIIQEKVVVGGNGGNNKIASLLDRGNMALEDGDWAKADSFFEDVLNNDSKNAQAYIGKTLAQERCRTMDALVRKRKDVYQNVRTETLYIKENTAHINSILEQYNLPGYVDANIIRNLYKFDLSYTSEVAGRQKQYHEEEIWWQNHRQLSRAEKFAFGSVAEHLGSEKNHLFTQLADRVKKAQEADSRAVAKLEAQYDAHIAEADKKAKQLYSDGLNRREQDYENYLAQAKKETNPETLKKLAAAFDKLGEYKDSKNLAEHCRKRATDEQAKIDAELMRKAAERARQNKKIAIIAAAAACIVIAFLIVLNSVIIPNNRYNDAVALMESGQKVEAATAFSKVGSYKDAKEQALRLWIEIAKQDTISAGSEHTVGLRSDGTAIAVGQNIYDRCNIADWTDIMAISAGNDYTAGLKSNGTVVAVGWNGYGQCNVSGWTDIIAISAGHEHTVGLKLDGTVVAVGNNSDRQCDVSNWTDIIAVSAGYRHTIGLKADGTVVARGNNDFSQCDVSKWNDIIAVSAGVYYSVGLKADGTVVAVGSNYYGQCDVSGWTDIVAISAGGFHTVGLKADGTVVTAGNNEDGQSNASDWTNIVAIEAGLSHTVGLKSDGTMVAVGLNSDGQCEVSGWRNIKLPAISDTQKAAMDAEKQEQEEQLAAEEARLAKEYAAAEALAENGEKGKAAIAFAKMGTYKDAKERSLQLRKEIAPRDTIDAGSHHIVGLNADGTVIAAGYNEDGRCNVSDWTGIISVSVGDEHTVGLKADSTVIATKHTGAYYYGQCDVSGWTDIISVSAGSLHTVGLKADGTVVAVGYNGNGQCEVSDWRDIISVSSGGTHTVGLKADGTVIAVGSNKYGQCDVSGWTDIISVSTGVWHTVGMKADGTVVAVGYNKDNQCNVFDWTDIISVSAGGWYTVGLKADGTVVATGSNSSGQCNVSDWKDIVAISAGSFYTVGLKAGGTVVAAGDNLSSQHDIHGWTDIKLPG